MMDIKKIEKYGITWLQQRTTKTIAIPAVLDIETSNNHAEDPKELITWMSSCQILFDGVYHLFRTPEEVCNFFNELIKTYHLGVWTDKKGTVFANKLLIFIHNASYDLSYLVPYFEELLPSANITQEITAGNVPSSLIDGQNSFITYVRGGLEFRCSYRLSNMGLEKWGKSLNIEHPKKVGLYDYQKIIYQDSELTANEQEYDKADVIALFESITAQNRVHKDNLITMPLTSTGYPRRALRESCDSAEFKEHVFRHSRLTPELYQACLKAYAGGYTHMNRHYKDQLVSGTIGHRDFKSFYPSIMRVQKFPIDNWHIYYQNNMPWAMALDKILSLSPESSTMTHLRIYGAKLKDPSISMPFLQTAKLYFKKSEANIIEDNGRIVYLTYEDGAETFLDNCTLSIINEQYDLQYEVITVWKCKNILLPHQITDIVDKYFAGKSDVKNIVHDYIKKYGETDTRTTEAQKDLNIIKALLNSLYGVTATNPLREDWYLTKDNETAIDKSYLHQKGLTIYEAQAEHIESGLDAFYSSRVNFLPYQIGVWITAYARLELFEYIKVIGYDNILYCDTDSAYYISTPEIENNIEDLNALKHATAPFTELRNGKKEYYDAFEAETPIKQFKGLHSKCYGYVNKYDELVTVIAGVPSKTLVRMEGEKPVYVTREEELGSLDNLKDGFTFKINSSVTGIYVGATGKGTERKPTLVEVNGHKISTAGGCVIRPQKQKKISSTCYDFIKEEEALNEPLPNYELFTEM